MNHSPSPIVVFGANRSGTKWLANILANHEQIAAVQSAAADGIMESNLFSSIPRKFDLTRDDDFCGFLVLWGLSDFVKQSGVDITQFAKKSPLPRTVQELFRLLMDRFAEKRNTPYWLQKFGPEAVDHVAHTFPESKKIIVFRKVIDTVHSTHHLARRESRPESLASTTFRYVLGEKLLRRAARKYGAHVVRYEDMRRDPNATMRDVCDYIGVEFHESMLIVSYQPNSSFRNSSQPEPMGRLARFWVRTLSAMLRCSPFRLLQSYAYLRPYARRTIPFVPGTFDSLRISLFDGTTGPLWESVVDEVTRIL